MKRRVKKLAALLLAFAVVVTFMPVAGLQTAYAESKAIQISDGEFKISELIDEQGLAHGDTLEIGANTILDVDVAFSLDKIVATTGSAGLTLKGDQFLEVDYGVTVGGDGTFTMESGELRINGAQSFGTFNVGIGGRTININGGEIYITLSADSENYTGIDAYFFQMNDGKLEISSTTDSSGWASGIFCSYGDAVAEIKGGTIDIEATNNFGYAYGIFSLYDNFVVKVSGGTTDIKVKRPDNGNYADAAGIYAPDSRLSYYMTGGKVTLDVVNDGFTARGINGGYYNISGGDLDIVAVNSTNEGPSVGLDVDQNGTLMISGGTVTAKAQSDWEGTGIGIRYDNSLASNYMDISGGTVNVTGSNYGIYFNNDSDADIPGMNHFRGTARVTAGGHRGHGIYGVRDGGLQIMDEARVTSESVESAGMYIHGPLAINDLPMATFDGNSASGANECAVYSETDITIADTLEITTPEGGHISADRHTIWDSTNHWVKKAVIEPKDVTVANVLFFNEITEEKITDGSVMVFKDGGPWLAAGNDPIKFYVGKGEDFKLTVDALPESGLEFTGWYKHAYPGTPFSRETTITQNITSETWYYAEFSPVKTVINSLTFTADPLPEPGKTKAECQPNVTVAEEGVVISGAVWVDMDEHHLPDDHVFTKGEKVKLFVDYYLDKTHKLAADIDDHVTVNGKKPETHSAGNTHFYAVFEVKNPTVAVPEGKSLTYNGKTQTGVAAGELYTVKSNTGKNVGGYKATVSLKDKENYTWDDGTTADKTVKWQINPKGAKLRSLRKASKAIYVKWYKQSSKMSTKRITGYQIQLATDSSFTENKKTVNVTGYKRTSKKVTKLKGNKKYYVRIRTYRTISGTKYYSPWSSVKTITTKK